MRRLYKILLLTGLTLAIGGHSVAQGCLDNLEDASQAYYNGNFKLVISLLGSCDYAAIENNSRSIVFELLIKSQLLLENVAQADSLMNRLLTADPLYQPRSSDILLYRELYDSYTLQNRWNFGIILGFNIPEFEILKYQSISSVVREPLNYATKPGFMIGINGELMLFNNLFVNTGLTYETFAYAYSEIILEYQQLDVEEKMSVINIPVSLRYEIPIGKFRPFIRAGIANHFLVNSKLALDLRAIPTDVPVPYAGVPYKTSDYDVSFQRKPVTFNYLLGLGIKRTLGTYQIEFAVNYEHGTQNLVKTEDRYSDDTLLNTYFYVPDDIRLSNLKFSFGIYKSILKPRKK